MRKGLSATDDEILRCCRDGDLALLRTHLEDEDNYVQVVNGTFGRNEVTLLFESVDHSQLNIAIYLCYKGVDVNTKAKHRGNNTPLHIAISKNNDELVKLLLSHRANTKIKNDLGETPLLKAQKCKKKYIDYLVRSNEMVTIASMICANSKNYSHKTSELTLSYEHELKHLGINFNVESATECLMLFAKYDLIALATKVIIAGATGFSQGIMWAEKYNSLSVLSLLLLCNAACEGNYFMMGQLLSDPPGTSTLPYMEKVQEHLNNTSMAYLFKTAFIVAVRSKQILTAGVLLKHSVMRSPTNVVIDWSFLDLSLFHELWIHTISSWAVSLELSHNKLSSLPSTILNFRNLRQLNLNHNSFHDFDFISELAKLPAIMYLDISDNQIKHLHKLTVWPRKLQFLDVSRTGLQQLPPSLSDLHYLESITCHGNGIQYIPNQFFLSNSLRHLDLKECKHIELSELELAVNKHVFSALKVVAPSGFVLSQKEIFSFDSIIDTVKPKNSIISQIKKLHIPKRQPFIKTNESRKVKLLIIGENGLHCELAHKLTKLANTNTQRSVERVAHDGLMNFCWNYSPTILKTKKVHFVTTLIRNYKQYSNFLSCLLPETVFVSIVLDLSRPYEGIENSLIAPLKNLLAYSKYVVLFFILQTGLLEESQLELVYKGRKEKIEKSLEEIGITSKLFSNIIFLPIPDIARALPQDLHEICKHFHELALLIIQFDKCILSSKHQLLYLHEVEQCIAFSRDNSQNSRLNLFKWNIETQMRKKENISDFTLNDHLLLFLKEIGTIFFFNLPLRDLFLYVFINPTWMITLFMHIADIVHSHRIFIISQSMLKDKLYSKYKNDEFSEINSVYPQICQILIHFNLIVPIIPEYYLISLHNISSRTRVSLSNSVKSISDQQHHRMLFRCEAIEPSFWSILISQILMKFNLINHYLETIDGLTDDYFNCYIGEIQFEMFKIKEKTAFDGFEVNTERTNEGFSMMTSICAMLYNFIYQNYNFPNELGQTLQVCVPCPTCQKLGIEMPKTYILDTILLCTVAGELLHCIQHSENLEMEQIHPAIYFNDIPNMGIHYKNSDDYVNFKRPEMSQGSTTNHTCNIGDVMSTIRYYHFKNVTISAFYAMNNEIRILHKIEHENIVKMLDFNANSLFIVLELLPSLSLEIFLSCPTIPLDRLIIYSFALQIISAIKYLHDNKIVYRILNPSSILISSLKYLDDRNLILTDFSQAAMLTPFGVRGLHNTQEFQAPEIYLHAGKEWYNESVDIFAYGQVLNAMMISVNNQYERDRGELIISNYIGSPDHILPPSDSNMSISSLIRDSPEMLHQRNLNADKFSCYPPYTLFIDLMRRCWYHNLRDRFNASILHSRFSRLEIHLFQSAKQAPDPTLIGCIIPVDYNGSKQIWAIGLDVNVSFIQYRISIIYVYDQEMHNVIYSIDVMGLVLTGVYSHFSQLVWTAERTHYYCNPLQKEKVKTTIKAYSPADFYQKYQFSILEETIAIATSLKFLYLGLSNGEIWLYRLTPASSSNKICFTKPYFTVKVSAVIFHPECSKISCIQFVEQSRTLWVVHGNILSIYREMEIHLIHCKNIESKRFTYDANSMQNPNLITYLRLDKYESIIWMSTLIGDVFYFDIFSFEQQLKYSKLSEINSTSLARHSNRKIIEIQSMCVGNKILWVGLTSGHVIMLTKSQIMKSWIRAHKSKVKTLEYIEYSLTPNPMTQCSTLSQTKSMIVSTGIGCHINTTLPQETNYIAKWEAMTYEEFKFLEKKCTRSSLTDELESLPYI